MTDDFPTPGHRNLPPEVRDRLRAKLNRDLAGQKRRPVDRVRGPLSIAAGVAILAAGAMIVAQSVTGSTDNPGPGDPSTTVSPPPPPLDMSKANAELDRCFAAAQLAGKADRFPPRAQWEPVHQANFGSRNVIGATAAGKVFFCETTNTEVTISDPNAIPQPAKGSVTSALLQTRLNTYAGITDLSWPWPWAEYTGRGGPAAQPLNIRNGLFINGGGGKVGGPIRVAENDPSRATAQWKDLPPAPAPAVSIVDRPTNPPPDRTSDRGRTLDDCIRTTNATIGVPDLQSWRPGAALKIDGEWVVVARNEFGVASCWNANGTEGFYDGGPPITSGRPESLGSTYQFHGGTVVAGTVPPAAARMAVSGAAVLDLHEGTFVVLLPQGVDTTTTKATLFASDNRVIYEGPLIF
jgi:hypothetical protein